MFNNKNLTMVKNQMLNCYPWWELHEVRIFPRIWRIDMYVR